MLDAKKIIYSIGHSTHPIDDFIQLLFAYQIELVADVRRFPSSKKNPQFQLDQLKSKLTLSGIDYRWLGEGLGGFRTGGYPLYMQSEPFLHGIEQLIAIVQTKRTSIMCAEKLFFRCHRRFIADHLTQLGWHVVHILDETHTYPHQSSDPLPLQI